MKLFTTQIGYMVKNRNARTNIKRLLRFLLIIAVIFVLYTIIFRQIMQMEGQSHSWVTGIYWTLSTMSTLGYGDITFTSDIGRLFSLVVLISGVVFLLIMLPFTFIEFFYAPWMEAQARSRAPRNLDKSVQGHVIITHYDAVTKSLIEKFRQYNYEYVLLVKDLAKALELHDEGYRVVVGDPDHPLTYKKLNIDRAAMVITTKSDMTNANVAHTVRELNQDVKIISTANSHHSVDILKLAGSNHVLHMGEILGKALSRRTIGQDARVHPVGRFGKLVVAESTTFGTPLVGKTLRESRIREDMGINVVGIWERGTFSTARPDSLIQSHSVLVLAGSIEQLRRYDELLGIYAVSDDPIIIIGAGRVGRNTAHFLKQRNLSYKIIEKNAERIRNPREYIHGDAADLDTLKKAGIENTPCIIITTHEDDINIYLTIYCRSLRPTAHILARSNLDRNVNTLHRAGADFVMSYASMGANAMFNIFKQNDIVMISEGLNIFTVKTPERLAGKTLAETNLRAKTGCNVIAYKYENDEVINPDPGTPIPANSELILIGNAEAEQKLVEHFNNSDH